MNIAFLLRLWPVFGGGETVSIVLANEFVKRGHHVTVIYFKDNIREKLPFIDPRIKTVLIPNSNCDESRADLTRANYLSQSLIQAINKNKIDIVINQWWPVEFVSRVRAETKAKLIKCHHTSVFRLDKSSKKGLDRLRNNIAVYFRIRRHLKSLDEYLDCCDKLVFLSPSFVEQYISKRQHLKENKKIDYVFNPLTYPAIASENDLRQKKKEVLYVGRLHELYKRLSYLLKCWKEVEDSGLFKEWRLIIVGEGPDKLAYQKMAEQLKLKNISFEGQQEPLSYYRKASIFTMTSANEGWSMTLAEAIQNGATPIVMDSFASLHHLVKNNTNGFAIPDGDLVSYTNQLMLLMQDREKRETFALNGIELCKKYAVDSVVDRWEEMFSSLLQA